MESLAKIISEHPFFKNLKQEHIDLIVGCAANVRFEPGQFIIREGDEASKFYLLRHGKVSLEIYVPHKGPVTIETLSPGDVLGWSWLFPPYKWHFDVRVLEMTRAIEIDGECIRNKCEEDPSLGYELMKRFAKIMRDRLLATRLQLMDLYGNQK